MVIYGGPYLIGKARLGEDYGCFPFIVVSTTT